MSLPTLPNETESDEFVKRIKNLAHEANIVDIVQKYASVCANQIHQFYMEKSVQRYNKKIDILSSLPSPSCISQIPNNPQIKRVPSYFTTLNFSSGPILSLKMNKARTHFLAGSLNCVYFIDKNCFFSDNNFHEPQIIKFPGDTAFCRCVAFHPCDILSGISKHNVIYLYDLLKRKTVSTINAHSSCVTGLLFAPDGSHIVSSSLDSTVKTYDLIKSQAIYNINLKERVTSMSMMNDGRCIGLGTENGNLMILDERQEGSSIKIGAHSSWMTTLAFSNNLNFVATAGADKSISLFDIRQPYSLLYRLFKIQGAPLSLSFDNNERIWTSTMNGEIQAWNTNNARNVYSHIFLSNEEVSPIYSFIILNENNSILFSQSPGDIKRLDIDGKVNESSDEVFHF